MSPGIRSALFATVFASLSTFCSGQELFAFTEPASNMPARSVSGKLSYQTPVAISQLRLNPEMMFGLSKKWMLHTGFTFSNMYADALQFESLYAYAKYRFVSIDEVHRHFRLAAFSEISYSRNQFSFEELSIRGDKSGAGIGLVATQLINKFAISGSVSHLQSLEPSRFGKISNAENTVYSAVDYTLSSGLLLLPAAYKNYRQTNLNIYAELMGQRALGGRKFYLDLAPSLQLIFNSTTKLNIGYRFELSGNESRNMTRSIMLSLDHTFLNALRKKH